MSTDENLQDHPEFGNAEDNKCTFTEGANDNWSITKGNATITGTGATVDAAFKVTQLGQGWAQYCEKSKGNCVTCSNKPK